MWRDYACTASPGGHQEGDHEPRSIEEMGPWRPDQDTLRREVFIVTPEARVELARRSDAPGGFPGQWGVEPLAAAAVRPGDYATLTSPKEPKGGRLMASRVVVVRSRGPE